MPQRQENQVVRLHGLPGRNGTLVASTGARLRLERQAVLARIHLGIHLQGGLVARDLEGRLWPTYSIYLLSDRVHR